MNYKIDFEKVYPINNGYTESIKILVTTFKGNPDIYRIEKLYNGMYVYHYNESTNPSSFSCEENLTLEQILDHIDMCG